MFQGFNEFTIMYYEAIRRENSREAFRKNERLYLEGVKFPLEELYFELYNWFERVDRDLPGNKRRCISSAYNDARFCCGSPIREYFYIRFKLQKENKKNELGFFFDASLAGYKYGLEIYHPDAGGMNRIRDYILGHKQSAGKIIRKFDRAGLLEVHGEKYKKPQYPKEDILLQGWLERKRISCIQEENLCAVFYERELLNYILSAFDSVKEIYFMLKKAL